MKKLSKKMLSILLAVMMVMTTLPISAITAFAEDLETQIAKYENDYLKPYATEGYAALTNHAYDGYQAYVAAVKALESETTADDAPAATALATAMTKLTPYTEPKANFEVKIGSGSAQPSASDYYNVLYANNVGTWDSNYADLYRTYTVWTWRNYMRVYYPTTVLLYDGDTENAPKFPIILGVTGTGNSRNIMQNFYDITNNVDLIGNWKGTNDGNDSDSSFSYPYTNPEWPHMQLGSGDELFEISNQAGLVIHPAENKYMATNSSSYYQIYKNSMVYTPVKAPTNGYETIPSTGWLGEGTFTALGIVTGEGFTDTDYINPTAIHIVNYKILKDEMVATINRYKDKFNVDLGKTGALGDIFEALQAATDFNPATEDYEGTATQIKTKAEAVGTKIENLIAALKEAVPDDVDEQARILENVINTYVAKMNSHVVWSNMLPAYQAYMAAKEYYDAYKYGGRREFVPELEVLAKRLNAAVINMEERGRGGTDESQYSYYPAQGFDGDVDTEAKSEAYKKAYGNLVWAGMGPDRIRSDNSDDDGGGRVLRIKHETIIGRHGTTNLHVPYAVAVYDGDHDMTVPVIVGFHHQGTTSTQGRRLYSYKLTTTSEFEFGLKYWRTRKTVAGDDERYYSNMDDNVKKTYFDVETGNTRTYVEACSLQQILNVNDAMTRTDNYAMTTDGSMVTSPYNYMANHRYNHGAYIDDVENFYANTLKLKVPTTWNGSSGKNKYFKKISNIGVTQYTIESNKNTYKPTTSSNNNNSSGSISTLGIYIINFKPVITRLLGNAGLLLGADFDIQDFYEGGLEAYLSDLDKITATDPRNYTYKDNATDLKTAVEACAQDIWELLEGSDPESALQVLTDDEGTYIQPANVENLKDKENIEGGSYYELKETLDNLEAAEKTVDPCIEDAYWNRYEEAVKAARKVMYNVAEETDEQGSSHEGYVNKYTYEYTYNKSEDEGDTQTVSHNNDNTDNEFPNYNATVKSYDTEIGAAFADLSNGEPTRHRYGYKEGTYDRLNEIATFECKEAKWANEAGYISDTQRAKHSDIEQVDMTVYGSLDEAYKTLDSTKYSNFRLISEGRADFDNVLDTGAEGAVKQAPQSIVDHGIQDLLEAINTANKTEIDNPDDEQDMDGKRISRYTVTFKAVNADTNEAATIRTQTEIPYGDTFAAALDASSYGNVFKWEVNDGKATRTILDEVNAKDFYVLDNITISAYYLPASAGAKKVTIKDAFGRVLYKFDLASDDVLMVKDNNTITAGSKDYKVANGLVTNITGWTVEGAELNEDGTVTVGDAANIVFTATIDKVYKNTTYDIKLDGQTVRTAKYDADVKIQNPDAYAFAVNTDDGYKIVAYGTEFNFYACIATTNFYTVTKVVEAGKRHYEVNGTTITDPTLIYNLDYQLPMVFSYAETTAETKSTTRSQFVTFGLREGLTVTEWGTLYTTEALDAETFTLDNVGTNDISKRQASSKTGYNQYSLTIPSAQKTKRYTRAYIKYSYSFTDNNNNTGVISGIAYGNICTNDYATE